MAKKTGLRLPISDIITSAGLATRRTDSVPPGKRWCIQNIAWEISKATSGGNDRVRLYIDRGAGDKFYIDEQLTPVADWLYTRSEVDFLYDKERLGIEIDQAQASTTVKLYALGYEEDDNA